MAKSKLAVGLDIGSSGVKLVQLKEKKGGYALQAFGTAPLPPEAIVDGALMNSGAIVPAIQELVAQHKVKAKEVAIGVGGHSVIIKKISMPRMTQEELDESIQWEAEQYIPFDVKDVNIDTQILTPEANAAGQMDVLLVAAKKDMINDYTSVCAEAGLTATVVDVDAFAVQNAFEANYELDGQTVVLINVGAAVSNINILVRRRRPPSPATSRWAATPSPRRSRSSSTSPTTRPRRSRWAGRARPTRSCRRRSSGSSRAVADQMGGEIQRSLDFFASTAGDARIARVYLSGGTARIPALFKVIEARAGVPVEILNPFKNIEVDNRRFDPAVILAAAPSAAVGVGLALRRPGDK